MGIFLSKMGVFRSGVDIFDQIFESNRIRGFISYEHCMENDINYDELNMNGTVQCKGSTCKLKCYKGYDFWKRGPRKSSCKGKTDPTKNGAGWNRSLSACQTCKAIPGMVRNRDF